MSNKNYSQKNAHNQQSVDNAYAKLPPQDVPAENTVVPAPAVAPVVPVQTVPSTPASTTPIIETDDEILE